MSHTFRFYARRLLILFFVALLLSISAFSGAADPTSAPHVMVLSIDGMHAVDLALFVKSNPTSTMARLVRTGYNYTSASTPKPADSFPGLVAMFTGASPLSSGVYFDRSYDRSLWPPNTTSGPTGTPVIFDESVDLNNLVLDGGGGLNVNALPRDPARGGAIVYPHNYLRVNTVFEVAKAAGFRTSWFDKHLTDEIIQGPSGQGLDELWVPEIAADYPFHPGLSINKSVDATIWYDDMKLQGFLNQIAGFDHTGSNAVGVPTIFGMNFQGVSVAQKLKKNRDTNNVVISGTYAVGGYLDGAATPSPLVSNALYHTDQSLGAIVRALETNNLLNSTYIILMAKHGQAPIDPTKAVIANPAVVTSPIDPSIVHVAQATEDDTAVLWLADQTKTAQAAATLLIASNQANAFIQDVWFGEKLKLMFGDPALDSRVPDIIALGKPGVVYTTASTKFAEHGGFTDQDINVPIVVSNPNLPPQTIKTPVTTMQIAPTILQLLNLNPVALQAVQIEKTAVLPGFDALQLALNPVPPPLRLNGSSTLVLSNGQAQFQVSALRRQDFVVQVSTDLNNWSPLQTNSFIFSAMTNVVDSQASGFSNRFYRAVNQ
ncbi:MAG TPA: alkaline phosphatase family protein [Verrucomicrobiae bacterium]